MSTRNYIYAKTIDLSEIGWSEARNDDERVVTLKQCDGCKSIWTD